MGLIESPVGPLFAACGFPGLFRKSLRGAGLAPVAVRAARVALFAEADDPPTPNAFGRLIIRRIRQLLKVVFVGAEPHVPLGLKVRPAVRAVLPSSGVAFVMVMGAPGVAPVVAVATVPGIGEEDVFVLVVANPLAAAFRAGEPARLAAQSATRCVWFRGGRFDCGLRSAHARAL